MSHAFILVAAPLVQAISARSCAVGRYGLDYRRQVHKTDDYVLEGNLATVKLLEDSTAKDSSEGDLSIDALIGEPCMCLWRWISQIWFERTGNII